MAATHCAPRVILVCGYSRHGKDAYADWLAGYSGYNFDEYIIEGKTRDEIFGSRISDYKRIAFATILKEEVAELFGTTVKFIDENKDRALREDHAEKYDFTHQPVVFLGSSLHPFTYRDVLIDLAAKHKSKDVMYFARRTFERALKDLPRTTTLIVTDWRYPDEREYALGLFGDDSVVTVRAVRPQGTVPLLYVQSEHMLDMFSTDVIVQPRDTPQCHSYGHPRPYILHQ